MFVFKKAKEHNGRKLLVFLLLALLEIASYSNQPIEQEPLMTINSANEYSSRQILVSPDSSKIISLNRKLLSFGSDISVWDVNKTEHLYTFKLDSFLSNMTMSPDGKSVVSKDAKFLKIIDFNDGSIREKFELNGDSLLGGFTITPDGKKIITSEKVFSLLDNKSILSVHSVEDGALIKQFTENYGTNFVAIDNNTIASLVISKGFLYPSVYIKMVNLNDGSLMAITEDIGMANVIARNLAINNDKTIIAWTDMAKNINIYELSTKKVLASIETKLGFIGLVMEMKMTQDNKFLIYTDSKGRIEIWNIKENKLVASKQQNGYAGNLTIAPDGKYFLVSEGNVIRLYDMSTGDLLVNFIGHTDTVTAITIMPNDKQIASGSSDRTIKLWNLPADLTRIEK
jgi:WD40 repeat protein